MSVELPIVDPTVATAIIKKSKAELRASIFAPEKLNPIRTPLKYQGEDIEFISPSLASLSSSQADNEGKNAVVIAMIQNCVVPGTDEKIFDMADYEAMVNAPVNSDLMKSIDIITKILTVTVEDKAKN